MRILKMISRNRRDFRAIFVCDDCGHQVEKAGYDDTFFHTKVIPSWLCPECNKKAGDDYVAQEPRYPDGVQV